MQGVVRQMFADQTPPTFVIENTADGKRREVEIRTRDRIFVNHRQTEVLKDLHVGDRVVLVPRSRRAAATRRSTLSGPKNTAGGS